MGQVNLIQPAITRQALMALENAARDVGDPTDWDIYLTHRFAPGLYIRQFDLPADSLVVGKIHKHAHCNFLMAGVVIVASEFHTETFSAPRTWISEVGIKRAVHTLEDAMWVTVHPNPTNTQDLDELEAEVIAPGYAQLDSYLAAQLEKT